VEETVNTATQKTVDTVKAFDEKHQITRRLSDTAKTWNDKYEITAKVDKIKNNENVQKVSTKVNQMVKTGMDAVDQISKETKQLVNEKQVEHSKAEDKTQETIEQTKDETNPGASSNDRMSSAADEHGDKAEEAAPGLSTELQV